VADDGDDRRARAALRVALAMYRELTGRDPGTARAEVLRLQQQLLPLASPAHWIPGDAGAAPDCWTDDDLGAAADALIDWYCDGRRTDDPALAAVLAVWDRHEDLVERQHEALLTSGRRAHSAVRPLQSADATVRREYLAAWGLWRAS
jgi:hypothetical protein